MSIWRWADWLPSIPVEARCTLGEGDTPLVASRSLGRAAGLSQLWLKLESVSPTGSYKDRFAAVAISAMVAAGKRTCIATSSGNTGAALAAYCAAARVDCRIAIVETAPLDKLRQMLAYGARLVRVRGFGLDAATNEQAFEILQRRANRADAQLQISAFRYSPIGMSGVSSIAWELSEQLPEPPQHIFTCAGGGGLTLAIARGCQQLVERGRWRRTPAVHCVQPEGNATIAGPLARGESQAVAVEGRTRISGLQVASVLDGHETLAACRASGGNGWLVTDEDVWNVQQRMALEEGIFCEPAAAVPLAGALQARAAGRIGADDTVVCLVTGSGFKDAAAVERMVARQPCPLVDLSDLAGSLD